MNNEDIMRYLEIINERRDKNVNLASIISAAIKAKTKLSSAAESVISNWQSTNWVSGDMEMAFRQNNEIAREITTVFAPVRALIKSVFGSSITLYRGQRSYEQNELTNNRVLFSWSGDQAVASYFLYKHIPYTEILNVEIDNAVNQYTKTGFCKFGGYSYKRSNKHDGIYDKYIQLELIGDGDEEEMADDFKQLQTDRIEANQSQSEKGELITCDVPIDLIVWVTNDLNSKEFIVRLNPLSV